MTAISDTLRTLAHHETKRVNNFTLLRLIFAFAVLIGHSYPIAGQGSDPLSRLLLPYTWIGDIAVCGFFAISGFLVTGSIVKRGYLSFTVSRALRLYPAIIAYSLIAVFVIGPLGAKVPPAEYFQAPPWYNFLNIPLWQWNYNLPFVFPDNPLPGATNGSTWTLPAELRCYVLIFFLGFFGVFDSRGRANALLLSLLVLIEIDYSTIPMFGASKNFASPLTFFIVGALFWVNRRFVPMIWPLAAVAAMAPIAAIEAGVYHYVFPPCVVYLIFMFVYRLPTIDVDRFGDISYGLYIYAWPIQQLVWRPGQSAPMNILLATLVLLPLAYFSWRCVEEPALRLRKLIPRAEAVTPSIVRSRTAAPLLAIAIGLAAHFSKDTAAMPPEKILESFYLTDANWINGIARHQAGFFVPNEPLYERCYIAGAVVQLGNGEERRITRVQAGGAYLNVFVDGPPLDPGKVGKPNTFSIK